VGCKLFYSIPASEATAVIIPSSSGASSAEGNIMSMTTDKGVISRVAGTASWINVPATKATRADHQEKWESFAKDVIEIYGKTLDNERREQLAIATSLQSPISILVACMRTIGDAAIAQELMKEYSDGLSPPKAMLLTQRGTLTITGDISQYTYALALQPGTKTECLARFSTVAGEAGAADGERDVRGFALKFYTEEGNWDMVGNNTPVFFVRDPYKFPDFIHTQKRHPKTHLRSATAMWDFWSLMPESLHQVTILFSDRGIPLTLRHMNGYGSHTYSLINQKGERHWVKFHFKTLQGIQYMTNEESYQLIGRDRESHQRDLFHTIDSQNFPQWKFQIQVMTKHVLSLIRAINTQSLQTCMDQYSKGT
jgi:hypothetical protein